MHLILQINSSIRYDPSSTFPRRPRGPFNCFAQVSINYAHDAVNYNNQTAYRIANGIDHEYNASGDV